MITIFQTSTFSWEYYVENQLVLKNAYNGKNEVKKAYQGIAVKACVVTSAIT